MGKNTWYRLILKGLYTSSHISKNIICVAERGIKGSGVFLEKPLYVCIVRIKEQVGEKRMCTAAERFDVHHYTCNIFKNGANYKINR